jgi:hypothetical protein
MWGKRVAIAQSVRRLVTPGVRSPVGEGIFFFATTSRPVQDLTQPPIQWVRRWKREAGHSRVSSAAVKVAWGRTCITAVLLGVLLRQLYWRCFYNFGAESVMKIESDLFYCAVSNLEAHVARRGFVPGRDKRCFSHLSHAGPFLDIKRTERDADCLFSLASRSVRSGYTTSPTCRHSVLLKSTRELNFVRFRKFLSLSPYVPSSVSSFSECLLIQYFVLPF